MKLYVPSIGDSIRLTAPWTFGLFKEDRNFTLMEYLGDPRPRDWNRDPDSLPATIPADSILKIDRIYIRKGMDEYSSITFFLTGARTSGAPVEETDWESYDRALNIYTRKKMVKTPRKPVRFWAKLEDCNNIEFEPA